MAWFNLNDGLNNLKGQLSNFASGVLTDGIVNDADSDDPSNNTKEKKKIHQLELEVERLHKELARYGQESNGGKINNDETGNDFEGWSWNVPEESSTNTNESENEKESEKIKMYKEKIKILEFEKRDLIQSLDQLDIDCQQTTDKLITLKDEIQTDYNVLKDKYNHLKNVNDMLTKEKDGNNTLINDLKTEVQKLQESSSRRDEEIQKNEFEIVELKNQENNNLTETEIQSLIQKVDELNKENSNLKSNNRDLEVELEKLKDLKIELNGLKIELKETNESFRNKFLIEFKENLKKFVDYDLTTNDINNYNDLIENVIKLLLNYKWKNETLEKQLLETTQEKTKILQEKNHEIEKLLKNSEILSQEVISKSQQLKHYENECNELIKNNDLLIIELDNYKNTSGLQTISETNEDNMLLLESQLENANKKNKELELTINDMEKRKEDDNYEVESELEYIKKQLNLTGTELSQTKNDYKQMKNDYEQVKNDYEQMKNDSKQMKNDYEKLNNDYKQIKNDYEKKKNDYEQLRNDYEKINNDNEKVNNDYEKMRNDYENTEYKCSELNVDMERIIEEMETQQKQIEDMNIINKKLEMQNLNNVTKSELLTNEIDDLKKELTDEIESKRLLDIQIRNLTEKLQNAKMQETSLKLQYDTLHKEFANLTEAKQSLEIRLKRTNDELKELEIKLNETLELNNNLTLKLKDYATIKSNHDDLLKKINDLNSMNVNIMKENDDLVRENEEYCHEIEMNYTTHKDDYNELNDNLKKRNEEHLKIIEDLSGKNEELLTQIQTLTHKQDELLKKCLEMKNANDELSNENFTYSLTIESLTRRIADQNATDENKENLKNLENISQENLEFKEKIKQCEATIKNQADNLEKLTSQLNEAISSRNQLVEVVQSKHQENVQYHNEIQRLAQMLKEETTLQEKTDRDEQSEKLKLKVVKLTEQLEKLTEQSEKLTEQNDFLRQKCEVLARNLLEEQSNLQKVLNEHSEIAAEKELMLTKELDRLKKHLIEVEDLYTKELLTAEQKNGEMQCKINEMEQREKTSSNMYTSVSIRANQQVETLQNQLQLVTNQRDEFRKKISDSDDHIARQNAALTNLQLVLEQFQKDKEKSVYGETERIRKQITMEKGIQEELRNEITYLKSQLDESKQGLQAAYRLTDQLENVKQQNNSLKEEVQTLKENLLKVEEKNKKLTSQTGTKVDKLLIKNLIVGFVTANNNLNKDQTQILKIISTVLDFTQEDNEKVKRPNQETWLNSILHPSSSGNTNINHESLSQAFVRFLENESKPRVFPNLLDTTNFGKVDNSNSNTPRNTPPLLSAVVLPTFSDFAQSRNSSSILKDVLKDNS